jgi:hypothetical protein
MVKSILPLLIWACIVISRGNNQCIAFTITPSSKYIATFTIPTITCSQHRPLWMTTNEEYTSTEPVKAVLCPNCDQCDGSGRFVVRRQLNLQNVIVPV